MICYMSFLNNIKDKVLREVPLDSLIAERVSLKSKGSVKVGLCPFHNEKTPSFTVYSNSYYCFGCHAYGDAISFVRQTLGLSFFEAIKYLVEKYSINIPNLQELSFNVNKNLEYKRLFSILSAAQNIYHQKIFSSDAKCVIEYLNQRSFEISDIKKFGFGYSPPGGDFIIKELIKLGFTKDELVNASLAVKTSRQYYDFFQNRLMIPIKDHLGRIVGFGARALSKFDEPKYKNTKETDIFDKGSLLFGFFEAKEYIRKGYPAIIVEGYIDVFRLWQKGFLGAMACMGTALRLPHLKTLSNITNTVYLVFDGDGAGQKATLSTLTVSLCVPSLNINVVVLPSDEDPDSYLLKSDVTMFQALIDKSVNLFEFVIETKIKNASYLQIPHIIKEDFVPWLSQISDNIQRSFLINKIATLAGIPVKDLQFEVTNYIKKRSFFHKTQGNTTSLQDSFDKGAYSAKLGDLEKEFISHLYFSLPQEIDLDLVEKVLYKDMILPDSWLSLAKEFIHVLKVDKKSPKDYPLTYWNAALDEHILIFLENLSKNFRLFETSNRAACLNKVAIQYEIQNKKALIANLKNRMLKTTQNDTYQILQLINKINKDIMDLSSRLKE